MSATLAYRLKRFVPAAGFGDDSTLTANSDAQIVSDDICSSATEGNAVKEFYDQVVSCSTTVDKDAKRQQRTSRRIIARKTVAIASVSAVKMRFDAFLRYCSCRESVNMNVIMNTLLQKPNYLNSQDFYGWTPLMCASYEGISDVVAVLLDFNADRALRNNQGQTALDLAESRNHRCIVDLLTDNFVNFKSGYLPEKKFCDICNTDVNDYSEHVTSTVHVMNKNEASSQTPEALFSGSGECFLYFLG